MVVGPATLQALPAMTLWTVWTVHPNLFHPPTWDRPGLGDPFHWLPMPAAHGWASEGIVLPAEAQLAVPGKAGNVGEIHGLGGEAPNGGCGGDSKGGQTHWGVSTVAVSTRRLAPDAV